MKSRQSKNVNSYKSRIMFGRIKRYFYLIVVESKHLFFMNWAHAQNNQN
jgi:hypothetical protein